jgi:Sec-independent protein translocase protein TatA
MPQIGWSEILVIILVAIIVIGPKDPEEKNKKKPEKF